MPNHITNILTIGRNIFERDPVIRKRMEEELAIDFDTVREFCRGETEMDFEKIVPGRPSSEDGKNEDWYHWSIREWGTKWNAYDIACAIMSNGDLLYHFDTAWSPPMPVLDALAAKFPTLWLSLTWLDEGDHEYHTEQWSNGKRVVEE